MIRLENSDLNEKGKNCIIMAEVKFIGITKPELSEVSTTEEFIAYVARVSNPSNQDNKQTAGKLLKYLIKNKHWSPFEMASMVVEINTTRDIARQILRHRSFSFQEFSQRYALASDLGFETREPRLQDLKNRQNSIEVSNHELELEWFNKQCDILELVRNTYDWAIDNHIAKEQARAVLPEGLTRSRMYMSGTIRSWIHYVDIRADIATQKEHREIAEQVKVILLEQLPSLKEYYDSKSE
jgi:thymidylate synthase (FAD)